LISFFLILKFDTAKVVQEKMKLFAIWQKVN